MRISLPRTSKCTGLNISSCATATSLLLEATCAATPLTEESKVTFGTFPTSNSSRQSVHTTGKGDSGMRVPLSAMTPRASSFVTKYGAKSSPPQLTSPRRRNKEFGDKGMKTSVSTLETSLEGKITSLDTSILVATVRFPAGVPTHNDTEGSRSGITFGPNTTSPVFRT
ncbi:unnamed protein product [Trypanosoma congolense IL3000]|uniref:WGS project CAEQ00000000 data, annotated contig 1425 n=1 Tax=Trypanosoma congolense (strain IL3000) TaxID=1068625 RepID=F9W658_TRYCI|nr:unnamed protein product [Trypanosoma congolense IL3000]